MNIKQQKDIVEFVTVSAEFCAFLETAHSLDIKSFVEKSVKLLSLLYLKSQLLPEFEIDEDDYCEKYVTEQDWNIIHSRIANLMGENDAFFDVTESTGFSTGETVNTSISEAFADIFQDLRDFIQIYREGYDESIAVGLYFCKQAFKEYWGIRVLGLLQELHLLQYSDLEITERS